MTGKMLTTIKSDKSSDLSKKSEGAAMIEIDGYQVMIEWSEEDQVYLVSIPQLEQETGLLMPCSHGATYEEALQEAKMSIELALVPDMFAPPLVA
jgi:predicted RNase H-like HicB family nuclease